MRVLITGGGGNLGRGLAPTLEEAGHEPILMDHRDLETSHRAVRGSGPWIHHSTSKRNGCS